MSKNRYRLLVIITGVIAAAIHILLGVASLGEAFGVPFILNGVIYLALVYAVAGSPSFLQGRESLVHYLLMGFAALTIVLYFVFNGVEGLSSPAGIITKVDELLLILFTWLHLKAGS